VGIRRAQHFFGSFQLLGTSNQSNRRARTRIEMIPKWAVLDNFFFGELVGFVNEACITDSEWAIPIIWNTIVTEAVYVIDLQPVVVHGKKIITREFAIKVGALAEV